jgi:hypothetical protein
MHSCFHCTPPSVLTISLSPGQLKQSVSCWWSVTSSGHSEEVMPWNRYFTPVEVISVLLPFAQWVLDDRLLCSCCSIQFEFRVLTSTQFPHVRNITTRIYIPFCLADCSTFWWELGAKAQQACPVYCSQFVTTTLLHHKMPLQCPETSLLLRDQLCSDQLWTHLHSRLGEKTLWGICLSVPACVLRSKLDSIEWGADVHLELAVSLQLCMLCRSWQHHASRG